MRKGSVMPMCVYHRTVPMLFVQALIASYKAMPNLLELTANSNALPNRARTMNGEAFLESQAEWALLLDDDMWWEPAAIKRLLKTAKEQNAKVVSGFALIEKKVGEAKGMFPHAYQIVEYEKDKFAQLPMADIPLDEPFPVHAAGGACLLVHREVLEKLRDMAKGLTAYPWWEEVYQPAMNRQMGEDLVFCQRIRKAGYQIWYEPRAEFMHMRKADYFGKAEWLEWLQILSVAQQANGDIHTSDEG